MVTFPWQFRELRVSLRSPRTRKRYGRTICDKSPTRTREAQATEESLYHLPRARAAAEKGLFPLIPVPKPVPETPSTSPPHEQRNAYRRSGARLQIRAAFLGFTDSQSRLASLPCFPANCPLWRQK